MKNNLALLHAFEVSIAHKCMNHKNGKLTDDDLHDLAQVFYPILDILKPMVDNHSTDELMHAVVVCIEEYGKGIGFDTCPCSMHRPDEKE